MRVHNCCSCQSACVSVCLLFFDGFFPACSHACLPVSLSVYLLYFFREKKKSINKQTIIRVKNERTGDEAGDSIPSSSSSSAVNRRHHFPHTMVNTALYADREKLGRGGLAEQKQRPFSQDVGGRGEGREGRREGDRKRNGKGERAGDEIAPFSNSLPSNLLY